MFTIVYLTYVYICCSNCNEENEIFDVYNNDLFPEIEVSELYKDVYKYSLNKKGKIFHLLKKKNKISKYI